jgi:hypothetical protein
LLFSHLHNAIKIPPGFYDFSLAPQWQAKKSFVILLYQKKNLNVFGNSKNFLVLTIPRVTIELVKYCQTPVYRIIVKRAGNMPARQKETKF